MGNGYVGTILRVNLAKGTIVKEPLNQKSAEEYVGARGLGTKYYCDECDPNCDPLGPDNKLIFMTGPLTGTCATSSGQQTPAVTSGPNSNSLGMTASSSRMYPTTRSICTSTTAR